MNDQSPSLPSCRPELPETLQWLQHRLSIAHHRASGSDRPQAVDHQTLTAAAVLVPLIYHAGHLSVLLTQRTEHLSKHPGRLPFPAGAPRLTTPRPRPPHCAKAGKKSVCEPSRFSWLAGYQTHHHHRLPGHSGGRAADTAGQTGAGQQRSGRRLRSTTITFLAPASFVRHPL